MFYSEYGEDGDGYLMRNSSQGLQPIQLIKMLDKDMTCHCGVCTCLYTLFLLYWQIYIIIKITCDLKYFKQHKPFAITTSK